MMEFMGYIRPDGKVGARNFVAVIPSVTCANDVALAICRQVQGTVTYLHHQGCCQLPPDLERVTDTLISIGCSPNTASVLIVSLGCEGTDHERMVKEISATGKRVEIIHIQELGGVSKAIMPVPTLRAGSRSRPPACSVRLRIYQTSSWRSNAARQTQPAAWPPTV